MRKRTHFIRHLFQSALALGVGAVAFCASSSPQLITPHLPPGIQGQPYSGRMMIGSVLPLANATVTGLPAGMTAISNGSGSISIGGTPAASGTFTLALVADNTAGGTLTKNVSLVVHHVANNVTIVSAGYAHSCAVLDGGVHCWGRNDTGQLGNNSTTQSRVPVQTIPAGSNVSSVSAGNGHSCAVVNGGVKCWGANNGALGNNSGTTSTIPVEAIAAGSNATAVSAGLYNSCAVVDGGVQCWGGGGQGNNTNTRSLVPVQTFPAGSNATSVSTGYLHTCAAVSGGVQCWGSNFFNVLLLGDNVTSSLVPVQLIGAGSNVTKVSAGRYHSCALANGGVQCWGYNGQGQLGNNSNAPSLVPVQAIAAGSFVSAISVGSDHTCAVVNGGVQCWGFNHYGQLGDGTINNSFVPVQVIVAGSGVTSVSAGERHSCAVVGGVVKCWGYNYEGELGNVLPPSLLSPNLSLTPTQAIPAGSNVTSSSAGYRHACGTVDGGAQCWGYNGDGQLGNNSTATHSLIPVAAIPAGSNVTAVSTGVDGSSHSCAVINAGVQCWGFNSRGQLGNNSTTNSPIPVQTIAAGSMVTAVSAGSDHTCAVANGGVQCWGNNTLRLLGNTGFTQSIIPVEAIAAGSNVTGVSAGAGYTCAVANGGVQCWGLNNSFTQSVLPLQIIAAGNDVTAVAVGSNHTCALASGGVRCWGRNTEGQLGNNSTDNSAVPVHAIPAGSNVTALSAGQYHTCAVIGGGVQCWGGNTSGQLGIDSTTRSGTPVQVIAAGSNVSAVSAGYSSSCATVSGGLACWGYNGDGQLADAYSAPAFRPVTALVGVTLNTGVQSRKAHGSAGTFDLAIDNTLIAPEVTVEPRANGSAHVLVFQFNYSVTTTGAVTVAPIGTAVPTILGNEVLVTLTGIPDNRRVIVTLTDVNGSVNPSPVSIGFLVGDTNNSRSVNSSDISSVKARVGQTITRANFKFDVNASGAIDSGDISAVKFRAGSTLP